MEKKILCFYEYPYVKDLYQANFDKKIWFLKGAVQDYKKNKRFEEVEILSVFIDSILDQKNIDKFPNLKFIITRSTGTDHIDLSYAKRKKIEVINIPDYGSDSVAEYAIALLLTLSKKIILANEEVKSSKDFSTSGIHEIEGFELKDKKIGIIGTGRIGKKMALLSKGLGLDISLFDKFPDEKFAKKNKMEYLDLENILENSDILSFHLPLIKETKNFISKKEFKKMKDGVVLVNTSRGEILKTKDLFEFLKNGKIALAGFDVLAEEECLGREHHKIKCNSEIKKINKKIIKMKNVIVTPHNAFNTKEATKRRVLMSLDEIKKFSLHN